jgi:hypothetical protein
MGSRTTKKITPIGTQILNGKSLKFYSTRRTGGGTNPDPNPIVTDGLILHLDAGNSASYPGSGTTWTNLIDSSKNATLTAGITYSSSNQGYLANDGVNDYITMSNTAFTLGSAFTIEIWYRFNSTETNVFTNGGLFTQSALADWNSGAGSNRGLVLGANEIVYVNSSGNQVWTSYTSTPTSSAWHQYVFTFSSGTGIVYVDQTIIYNQSNFQASYNGTNGTYGFTVTDSFSGIRGELIGFIANVKIYNRTLGTSEILQNFNALRKRFGI